MFVFAQALKDVPRQAYVLTTKVGKYSPDVLKMYDYSFSRTEESVNNSLNKLQVDCIDIVQVIFKVQIVHRTSLVITPMCTVKYWPDT